MNVSAALRIVLELGAAYIRQGCIMGFIALSFVAAFLTGRSMAQEAYCFTYVSATNRETGKTSRSGGPFEQVLTFPNSK